jgi:hypothetical protein
MLCKVCASIFEGEIEPGETYDHHASAKEIQESVARLCHMCCIVERHLNNDFGTAWTTSLSHLEYFLRTNHPAIPNISDDSDASDVSSISSSFGTVYPALAPMQLMIVCRGLESRKSKIFQDDSSHSGSSDIESDFEIQINLTEVDGMFSFRIPNPHLDE